MPLVLELRGTTLRNDLSNTSMQVDGKVKVLAILLKGLNLSLASPRRTFRASLANAAYSSLNFFYFME